MRQPYRCLVLDHDDTAVDSSRTIHYPAHIEVMRQLRPSVEPVSFEIWMEKNFHPGVMAFLKDELGMNDREIMAEYDIWQSFTTRRIPNFFPGFIETIRRFKEDGGIVTVVSHSEQELILRDYRSANHGVEILPDMIFGWDFDAEKRKPSPWPLQQIMERYHLRPEELLIVDDLKPGLLMGRSAGVDTVAAGWAYSIETIRTYMEAHCIAYCETVAQLYDFLFSE